MDKSAQAPTEKVAVSRLDSQPMPDLEEFMLLSQLTRLGGNTLEKINNLWDEWSSQLNVYRLTAGTNSFLAIWLPKTVEEEIDAIFAKSADASTGVLFNNLASYLVGIALNEHLPQLDPADCPPKPDPQTVAGLVAIAEAENAMPKGSLTARYSIVTSYPFKGKCEVCHERPHCEKLYSGNESCASRVLPGYEEGID